MKFSFRKEDSELILIVWTGFKWVDVGKWDGDWGQFSTNKNKNNED